MYESEPTVFIVDDSEAMCRSLSMLVETVGLKAKTYSSAEDFLENYDASLSGCLLLDVRMPGMSGLELQYELLERRCSIPVIIITGHGDIQMAVQAIKAGAVDFIEKPFRHQVLLDNIQKAIKLDTQMRSERVLQTECQEKLALLTSRERQVFDLLVVGKSNKEIGYKLGISQKTVDFHRANILEKMGVNSVVELVLLTQKLESV
jgi:two-component system response regulator FixJ